MSTRWASWGPNASRYAEAPIQHRLPRLILARLRTRHGPPGLGAGPRVRRQHAALRHHRPFPHRSAAGRHRRPGPVSPEAHNRGLRIVLDGVFNHVGRDFPKFQQALQSGPDSGDRRLVRTKGWPEDGGSAAQGVEGHERVGGEPSAHNPSTWPTVVRCSSAGAVGWSAGAWTPPSAVPTGVLARRHRGSFKPSHPGDLAVRWKWDPR